MGDSAEGGAAASPLPLASVTAMRPSALRKPDTHRLVGPKPLSNVRVAQRKLDGRFERSRQQHSANALAPTPAKQALRQRRSIKALAMAVTGLLGRAIHTKAIHKFLAVGALALVAWRSVPAMLPWLPGVPQRPRSDAAGARRVRIMWFRSDLRLHDNEALTAANEGASSLLPVFIFDPREFSSGRPSSPPSSAASGSSPSSSLALDRTGVHRARFLIESVAELRRVLRAQGSDLIVRVGHPESVLPALAQEAGAGAVHCHSEPSFREAHVEGAVRSALQRGTGGAEFRSHWGGTLHALADLPFALSSMPGSYAEFRSKMQGVTVREALPCPSSLKGLPLGSVDPGEIPTLQQLGFQAPLPPTLQPPSRPLGLQALPAVVSHSVSELKGGEAQALVHMRRFLAELRASAASLAAAAAGGAGQGRTGAQASGGSGGSSGAFSCQVSPWLAAGCLSPRLVYHEALKCMPGGASGLGGAAEGPSEGPSVGKAGAAAGRGAAPGTAGGPGAWLVLELMWRDFFRLITQKYTQAGLQGAGAGGKAAGLQHSAAPAGGAAALA